MKDQTFEPLKPTRTLYFDYLKVFEYFFMAFVHAASYQWYCTDVNSSSWLVLNFYKSVTRTSVLPFFMISGALLLGREIPFKKLFRKYILKLVIVFFAWDFIYAVITNWNNGLRGMAFKFINSNYHLWYLLAMIGLYLCFPIFRLIAQNPKVLKYFLLLSFIFAFVVPSVLAYVSAFGGDSAAQYAGIIKNHITDMHMDAVLGYSFFFLGGYYIHTNDIGKTLRRTLYIVGAASGIAAAIINAVYVRMLQVPDDTFENSFMLHEMLLGIAVFIFFKYNVKGRVPFFNNLIVKISSIGLGIYMVHDLALLGLNKFLHLNGMTFNPIFAVPVTAFAAFVLSVVISWVLNKIPFVKKYLV